MTTKKILFASTRNWCTTSLSSFFKSKGHDCFIISADSSFGDLRIGFFFLPLRLLNKFFKPDFYLSYRCIFECFIFDLFVCLLILYRRPDCCVLWSGMSSNSLKICNLLGIRSVVWLGEEYLGSARKRNVLNLKNYWISELDNSLSRVDFVLVESTFVLDSLPLHVRQKTHVIYSGVSSEFYNLHALPLSGRLPVKVGIIGTSPRKNTRFALQIFNRLNTQQFQFHFFGDLSFFKNNIQLNPSLVFHNYYDCPDAYIKSLNEIDIFLFPTLSDAGPRALLEVTLLNKFVVASKYSIAPDLSNYFSNITVLPLKIDSWVESILSYTQSDFCPLDSEPGIFLESYDKRITNFLELLFISES